MPTTKIFVRPASVADRVSIAHICLLTANNGRSAEKKVRHPELPSQVRALPYLYLPSGFSFVLVETLVMEKTEIRRVVGYVVGTAHAAQFEREVDTLWWPILRAQYSKDLIGTPLDRYFVDHIYKSSKVSAGVRSVGHAHFHVNVVRKYRELDCDHLLVDVALHHLRTQRTQRTMRSI
ncbi:hypothetical protein EW145_g1538 [Phellinidium pouzarii]|uniref:N-acetyltransferase domain-containing protein n=1 Tax=Phellinidium pouzarii TaxID=167371 RepID=A0A4S4LEL2_9AGAM|nr:hypothetical protein EW145_g1538 [Phellinidium pouzarii]